MDSIVQDNQTTVNITPAEPQEESKIVSHEQLLSWEKEKNRLDYTLENIISNNSLKNLCVNRENNQQYNHLFSHKVTPRLPITNQKSSGRCWIFAALNVARREMIEKYRLKDFEFSQNYLFFWDKLERINYNLNRIIETREYDIENETVRHVLNDPLCDGGQWDMIVNLVEKYGLIPKSSYQESFHSSRSSEMNNVLQKLFRSAAAKLRVSSDPYADKKSIMKTVYKLLCKFLGSPPNSFEWEYYDKDNQYHQLKTTTPLQFYKQYVDFNFTDYVCVVNDPRKKHPYNKLYTVKYLGNVEDGNPVLYLNVDIGQIKELIEKSIMDNKGVWFGCDVGQHLHRNNCAMDLELVDYSVLDADLTSTKEERLLSKESLMTHAMCITGFNRTDDYHHTIDKWQVENSWGKSDAAEGYYIMSDKWFDEYVYEIAIHKKYLSSKHLEILENRESDNITVLPPWDPMGSLA